jgi:subtilisin-like proprotein convertase family protein
LGRVVVDQPYASRSTARLVSTGHDPQHEPKPIEVAARVIVDGDLSEVARAVGRGARVRSAPMPGFVFVETGSVASAIAMADRLSNHPAFGSIELDVSMPRAERTPTDPFFPGQWNLRNLQNPLADVRALDVWNAGYTGAGVVVGVIELGWQVDHPDLSPNFIASASMDPSAVTSHATSVAGVIGAAANGTGGVGVAYNAGLSRLIFGLASDNADAFLFRNDLNDIKNNSWGPQDNGRLGSISALELAALEEAARFGRDGLGEIVVWAAGNGGLNDRVDYDPYASSRFTLAIGAIGDLNVRADYNELGSSMLAVAHSSGNVRNIFSTSTSNGYTTTFGGTSAAAPLAAGVIALMLEANPALTWRDVQHIIVNTARRIDESDETWVTNGAQRWVSENYGYGAIDAHAAVVAAEDWASVGPEVVADSGVVVVEHTLGDQDFTGHSVAVTLDRLVRVESVEVVLTVLTPTVGDLHIELLSPSGTLSVFSTPRPDPTDHLISRTFTTLRSWDESSAGSWTVRVADQRPTAEAHWVDVRVRAYGTAWSSACSVDLTGDGDLTVHDVQAFLSAYQSQDPVADFALDGLIDFFDVQAFLGAWSLGCP